MIPNQKTTLAKKNEKFVRDNAKYWLSLCNFDTNVYKEMAMCYRAYFGELIKDDYKHVLNPFNAEEEKYKKFPARMRNYNIIRPIVDAKLGEASQRPFSPTVIVVNSDAENQLTRQLNGLVRENAMKKAVNAAVGAGLLGPESAVKESPGSITEQAESIKVTFRDQRAIIGQEALNVINYEANLKDFFQNLKLDYYVTGRVITYKEVRDDKVNIYKISPLDYWSFGGGDDTYDNSVKMLEDRDAHVWRRKMSFNQLVTMFSDELMEWHNDPSEEDNAGHDRKRKIDVLIEKVGHQERLDKDVITTARLLTVDENFDWSTFADDVLDDINDFDLYVFYIQWKTLIKVGTLTYFDESTGMIEETEVGEDYKLDESKGDIEIEWRWVNKYWQTIVTEDEYGVLLGHGAVEPSIEDPINVSDCKSSFNGFYKGNFSDKVISDVKSGLPYQAIYNTTHYNRELAINRNKEKLTFIPIGLMPDEFGDDPITAAMYYAMATNIIFIDETKPNAIAAIQALKQIDLSLGKYVEDLNNILLSVKQEWWDVVGFNRQRFGETYASDGKAVTEQALIRSSLISAEDERKFDVYIERECLSLLNISKYAWSEGKRGIYINSDNKEVMYSIDPDVHNENIYGLYIKNTVEEFEKMRKMQDVFTMASQKGNVSPWSLAEAIDATNFSKLKELAAKHDKIEKDFQQSIEQQKQQGAAALQQAEEESKERDRQKDILIKEMDVNNKMEIALISAMGAVYGFDQGENASGDAASIEDMVNRRETEAAKNALAERKQSFDEFYKRKELEMKERDLDIKNRKLTIDANRPKSTSK